MILTYLNLGFISEINTTVHLQETRPKFPRLGSTAAANGTLED